MIGPVPLEGSDESSHDSPPYSVTIGDTKIYGGLITYGHELHPARICRVLNGCIRNDGTVVLPAWTRRYDEMLSFHCGIHKLEFSLGDTEEPPTLRNLDLFGAAPAPVPIPAFLTEFAPQLVSLDMLAGDRELSMSCHSRVGRTCDAFPILQTRIRPAVLVDPMIQKQGKKTSWIKQFLTLIPTARFAHTVHRIPLKVRPEDDSDNVQCFRSIVLTRTPRTKFSINPETLRELRIFSKQNVSKTPKLMSERMIDNDCHVHVMFANRKKVKNSTEPLPPGYITNIGSVREEIYSRAKKFPGLSVKVSAVTLDAKRLKFQMDAMKKADMLVAGTGPALSNMIFLRTNSTVIELMPFGYYPKTYETLARYFSDVTYDSYIAHPDQKTFVDCLAKAVPTGSENAMMADAVIKRYKRAAAKYRQSDSTHTYTLHNLGRGFDFVEPCAERQRLNSNPEHFATAIIRNARLKCGIDLA